MDQNIEIKTKGVSLVTLKKFIITKFGEDKYKYFLNLLSSENKTLLETILPGSIIAFDSYIDILKKMASELNHGDLVICHELGAFGATCELSGAYKIFLMATSPEMFAKNSFEMLGIYYYPSGIISAHIEHLEKGMTNIKITGFQKHHKIIEFVISGFCKKGLELVGAKDVNIKISSLLLDSGGYFCLLATWK